MATLSPSEEPTLRLVGRHLTRDKRLGNHRGVSTDESGSDFCSGCSFMEMFRLHWGDEAVIVHEKANEFSMGAAYVRSWTLTALACCGGSPCLLRTEMGKSDFVSERANLESISTKPSQWTQSSEFSVDSYHPWVWYHLGWVTSLIFPSSLPVD